MKFARAVLVAAILASPAAAFAQDSTIAPPAAEPNAAGCSVSGSSGCLTPPAGTQPNTAPDSSQEGGTAGSTSGGAAGPLGNTSPGSTLDPGDSSGGSGGSSGGAAGPLGNSSPD